MNDISPYFNFENCKFANEQYKKNCARLAVVRDFNIFHSYTIETSCWGYSLNYSDETVQFKESDLIKFGEHLCQGIAKQFSIKADEDYIKINTMTGLDIEIDFAMYGAGVKKHLNSLKAVKKNQNNLSSQSVILNRNPNAKSTQPNKQFKIFSEQLNYKEKAKAKVNCHLDFKKQKPQNPNNKSVHEGVNKF